LTLGKGIEQLYVFGAFWAFATIATAVYLFAQGVVKTQLSKVIFDVIFSLAIVPLFLIANLHLNNGEFRLFVLFALVVGVLTSCICFRPTLDKLSNKLYNLFTKQKVDNNGKGIL
jgi:hypothetical protein